MLDDGFFRLGKELLPWQLHTVEALLNVIENAEGCRMYPAEVRLKLPQPGQPKPQVELFDERPSI